MANPMVLTPRHRAWAVGVLILLLLIAASSTEAKSAYSRSDFARMKTQQGAVMLSPTNPAVLDFRSRSETGRQRSSGLLQGTACASNAPRRQDEAVCESTTLEGKHGLLCCVASCTYTCQRGTTSGNCRVKTNDCALLPSR